MPTTQVNSVTLTEQEQLDVWVVGPFGKTKVVINIQGLPTGATKITYSTGPGAAVVIDEVKERYNGKH